MKKTILFFLILIFSVFVSSSEELKPLDLIILFDTSGSVDTYYKNITDYASGQLLTDYLNFGDTVHLLSFSDRMNNQISRKINSKDDLEILIGRMLLMYPINRFSDLISSLDFISDYLIQLPASRKKTVLILSDGIHDPPENSEYKGMSSSEIKNYIDTFIGSLNKKNIRFSFIRFPLSMEKENADSLSNHDLTVKISSSSQDSLEDIKIGADATLENPVIKDPLLNQSKETINNQINEKDSNTNIINKNDRLNSAKIVDKISADEHQNISKDVETSINVPNIPNEQETFSNIKEYIDIDKNRVQNNKVKKQEKANIEKKDVNSLSQMILNKDKTIHLSQFSKRTVIILTSLLFCILIFVVFLLFRNIIIEYVQSLIILRKKKNVQKIKNKSVIIYSEQSQNNSSSIMPAELQQKKNYTKTINIQKSNSEAILNSKPLTNTGSFIIKKNINSAFYLKKNENKADISIEIILHVEDQNTNIGRRNIHGMKSGVCLTVGGRHSHFLIFLVAFPYKIAEIYFTGKECIFVPRQAGYFPELMDQPLFDCIGKDIKLLSNNGHLLKIKFERFEDPLIKLNRILHSIDSPGIKDF